MRQLRGLLLDAQGTLVEDPSVIGWARERTRGGGDPDIAAASIAIVASAGDADAFEAFVRRAQTAPNPQEQLRYLYALGAFPTEELVLRACELALTDAIRAQNGPFVLQRALRSREHGPAAWVFVRDRWDDLRGRFCS